MKIEYREPSTINELESLFRLRYKVYSEDPLLSKMVSSQDSLDIDQYDLKAFHYGAFDGKIAIAYVRFASSNNTSFTNWVEQILSNNNIHIETKKALFPFQKYYPDSEWSRTFLASLEGRKIGEVGKLAIHKDYRFGGDHLEGFMSSFIEYCIKGQKIETGFGSCTLQLERYYRKFGFTVAEGAKPFIYEELPKAIILRFDK